MATSREVPAGRDGEEGISGLEGLGRGEDVRVKWRGADLCRAELQPCVCLIGSGTVPAPKTSPSPA